MIYVLTIGAILFIVGLIVLQKAISFIKKGNMAIASVVEVIEYIDSEKATMYKPVYKFISYDNKEIFFERYGSSSSKTWYPGMEVKIGYDGANPDDKKIQTLFNAFGLPLILLTAALVLLFIAGGYYWAQHFFNTLK